MKLKFLNHLALMFFSFHLIGFGACFADDSAAPAPVALPASEVKVEEKKPEEKLKVEPDKSLEGAPMPVAAGAESFANRPDSDFVYVTTGKATASGTKYLDVILSEFLFQKCWPQLDLKGKELLFGLDAGQGNVFFGKGRCSEDTTYAEGVDKKVFRVDLGNFYKDKQLNNMANDPHLYGYLYDGSLAGKTVKIGFFYNGSLIRTFSVVVHDDARHLHIEEAVSKVYCPEPENKIGLLGSGLPDGLGSFERAPYLGFSLNDGRARDRGIYMLVPDIALSIYDNLSHEERLVLNDFMRYIFDSFGRDFYNTFFLKFGRGDKNLLKYCFKSEKVRKLFGNLMHRDVQLFDPGTVFNDIKRMYDQEMGLNHFTPVSGSLNLSSDLNSGLGSVNAKFKPSGGLRAGAQNNVQGNVLPDEVDEQKQIVKYIISKLKKRNKTKKNKLTSRIIVASSAGFNKPVNFKSFSSKKWLKSLKRCIGKFSDDNQGIINILKKVMGSQFDDLSDKLEQGSMHFLFLVDGKGKVVLNRNLDSIISSALLPDGEEEVVD